jgi:hypothetical protein
MGLINWIFDIYQHSKIDEARREAAEARAEIRSLRSGAAGGVDVERLERALGELALATKTLQRLLVDKGLVSGSELERTMRLVDGEDGRIDGRSPF